MAFLPPPPPLPCLQKLLSLSLVPLILPGFSFPKTDVGFIRLSRVSQLLILCRSPIQTIKHTICYLVSPSPRITKPRLYETYPPARRGRRRVAIFVYPVGCFPPSFPPWSSSCLLFLILISWEGGRGRALFTFRNGGRWNRRRGQCVCVCAVWSSGLPSLKRRKKAHIAQRLCLHRHEGGDEILAPDIDGRGRGRDRAVEGVKKSPFRNPHHFGFPKNPLEAT